MKIILKLLLTAAAFLWILPLIPGIKFHGGLLAALILALFFAIMLWVVDLVALAISALLAIGSLGLALIWLIPLWLFGFWLLPAVALKVVADVWPTNLIVVGWLPAILGGLVMLLIGIFTSNLPNRLAT
jgi:hypothetical protein